MALLQFLGNFFPFLITIQAREASYIGTPEQPTYPLKCSHFHL